MKTIGEIKGMASGLLKNCWAESVIICLLDMGILCLTYVLLLLTARITKVHTAENMILIPERITPAFAVSGLVILGVWYVLTAPLYFGTRWFFWQGSGGGDVMPVSSVFAGYSSRETRMKSLRIRLAVDIRKLVPAAVCGGLIFLELLLARVIWEGSDKTTAVKILLAAGCAVMVIGAVTLYCIFTLRYISVGYIMAANPYAGEEEVFRLSQSAARKKYFYMLKMYAGNIRFLPLIFFIFPILVLRPYFLMTTAVFIRESMAENGSGSAGADVPASENASEEISAASGQRG